jgi:hypothetical protein
VTTTAAVVILAILLTSAVGALVWQQMELAQVRHDLRQAEREANGLRDDLYRRERLGVRPKDET